MDVKRAEDYQQFSQGNASVRNQYDSITDENMFTSDNRLGGDHRKAFTDANQYGDRRGGDELSKYITAGMNSNNDNHTSHQSLMNYENHGFDLDDSNRPATNSRRAETSKIIKPPTSGYYHSNKNIDHRHEDRINKLKTDYGIGHDSTTKNNNYNFGSVDSIANQNQS